MTNEQEERLAAMEGSLGDEAQLQSVLERTTEIIDQSFDLFRIISGSNRVSVLKGEQNLVSFVE